MIDPRMSDVCGLYSEDGICYRGYRCLQVLGYIYVYIVVLDMTHDFLYDFEAHGLTAPGGCIVICFTFFMLATCMTHSILIYADPGFIQPALLSNIRVKDQLDTCGACDYGRWKPYRALHCPSCRACVFQASDHNSGFGKCIGWGNRKIYCQYLACLSVSMGISAGVSVVALISMNLSLLRIFCDCAHTILCRENTSWGEGTNAFFTEESNKLGEAAQASWSVQNMQRPIL